MRLGRLGFTLLTILLTCVPAVRPTQAADVSGVSVESADEEFDLGLRHFARGEYRQAADAFARAGARWEPARKPLARYWAGLSWLATADAPQARSAFEDVAATESPLKALAQLGLASSWEVAKRPDRALETLEALTRGAAGEAGATALSRLAALARSAGEPDVARRATDRLLREYPASLEAAAARLIQGTQGQPAPRPVAVQLGAFSDAARARALAALARRSGFGEARVVERTEAGVRLQLVLIGPFMTEADARGAAARAGERLGVAARVVSAP